MGAQRNQSTSSQASSTQRPFADLSSQHTFNPRSFGSFVNAFKFATPEQQKQSRKEHRPFEELSQQHRIHHLD